MNKFRGLLIMSMAAFLAACATAPQKAGGPAMAAKPGATTAVANLAGNWLVTIESQMGAQDSKLVLKQTGAALTGTMEGAAGSVAVQGNVDGNNVKIWFSFSAQGTELKIDLIGTQDNGATVKGRAVFGSFGEGTFSAKRT